jgi:hypothetical protein
MVKMRSDRSPIKSGNTRSHWNLLASTSWTFYARALEGDVQCGALATKILERRCTMLGLHTRQTAVLQILDGARPKETSADRTERVLAELTAQKKSDPTTH